MSQQGLKKNCFLISTQNSTSFTQGCEIMNENINIWLELKFDKYIIGDFITDIEIKWPFRGT